MHINFAQTSLLRFGIGMTKLGIRENYDSEYIDKRISVIEKATEYGRVLVDTSPIYGNGFSEEVTSKVVSKLGEKVFISTKYYPHDMHRKSQVVDSIKGSLRRLNLNKIDLLQIHWPNWIADNEEILEGLQQAKQLGLVEHIGVCNFSNTELSELLKIRDLSVISNQIELNLLNIHEYTQDYKEESVVRLLYGALLQGRLSDSSHRIKLISWAREYGLSPSSLTIAYLLKRSYPSISIVKLSSIDHLTDLVEALSIDIDESLENRLLSISASTQYLEHNQIILKGDKYRKPYMTFEDALNNSLELFPSPVSFALRILRFGVVYPVKVIQTSIGYEIDDYDPFDQVKKFWAWRIAYPKSSIPVKVLS
jgi:aryl-alcohol dehydrogenase-like predicted oxidoreductase